MESSATSARPKTALTAEKETLFVPLLGKAEMSKMPHPIISDPKAEEILAAVDYDFAGLEAPRKTLVTLAMRAKKLDAYVRDYLARSPRPLVLHLGCGLDSRVLRTGFARGSGEGEWYDVDFPEVIELRRQFYDERAGYRMIGESLTGRGWLEMIGPRTEPACIVAEGVLMYLQPSEVERLFVDLQRQLPGSEISFDAFSKFTAKQVNRHPSIKRTGARIHWGVDDPQEIEAWGSGLNLLEEWFFTESEDIPFLGTFDRFMFRVMRYSSAAKGAQRILRYRM